MSEKTSQSFSEDLILRYPKSQKKVSLEVKPYNLLMDSEFNENLDPKTSETVLDLTQTHHLSPHGLTFQGAKEYPLGALLKIQVSVPNYWQRKQRFVEYGRVDSPGELKILAKVVKTEDVGKRGRKKLIMAQTVNIDEVDERVLREFLDEGK